MKRAFTVIELIFVIVILGILAAVAFPKLAPVRDDAYIAKAKSDIAALRTAIATERQGRLLQGQTSYINKLDDAAVNSERETIFDSNGTHATDSKLLSGGIVTASGDGHWMKTETNRYTFQSMGITVKFTYDPANGTFTCDRDGGTTAQQTLCRQLID